MDVGWAEGMTIQEVQENTGWSVDGERVWCWLEAVEPVLAVLGGAELSSQVVVGLVLWVLEIILSVGGCLPEVEDGVGDWLLGLEIEDLAVHQGNVAIVLVLDDGATELNLESWRCLMKQARMARERSSVFGPMLSMTCWVNFGSKRDSVGVVEDMLRVGI